MSPVVSRSCVPAGLREEHLADALFAAARAIKHGLRPELEREGLTSPMFWALNQLVLDGPLSRHIPVDVFVPGCPPSADVIYYALTEMLEGREPQLSARTRFGA